MSEQHTVELNDLLQLAVDENSSDLHLSVGQPPLLRLGGRLNPVNIPTLKATDTEHFVIEVASEEQQEQIRREGGTDFAISFGKKARFRTSIFRQRGTLSLVFRLIPSHLSSLEALGFPAQIKDLLTKPQGLILVTGPTGSGKTTTLASMIDYINRERNGHIITIEDPIEYYHTPRKCLVSQREVGSDVPGFSEALRRALRQDPDVILIGEMRDLETMEAGVTAAETGHLVFSTLHTTGAAKSIDRIVDAFPMQQQEQIRTQLASSILAVVSQQLIPRMDKVGRALAYEIMVATTSIRTLIRDKKTFRIISELQTGARLGMKTMDDSLYDIYRQGIVDRDEILSRALDKDAFLERLSES